MIEFSPRDASSVPRPAPGKFRLFMTEAGTFAQMDDAGNVSPLALASDIPDEYSLPTDLVNRRIIGGIIQSCIWGDGNRVGDGADFLASLGFAYTDNAYGTCLEIPIGGGTLKIQRGIGTSGANGLGSLLTFPVPFTSTSKCGIWATPTSAAGATNADGNRTYGSIYSTTQFQLGCDDNATVCHWLAIGP